MFQYLFLPDYYWSNGTCVHQAVVDVDAAAPDDKHSDAPTHAASA